ncbi:molecular chaperone HscC [Arenicella sp. 4NH20-0111]
MIVGIDLGTTNSLVAFVEEGSPKVIPNALGKNITPSVVGLNDDGEVIVGEAARQRLTTHPDKTIATFKRYMGTDRRIGLGRKQYRAEELSALVLKSLKADAESYLGQKVDDVVISVPAYFNDAQRKATTAAAKIAGLNLKRLINEPTAAAIAYGLHSGIDDSTFMVFDLGGGTFDISILELFDEVMQVHACAGDNHLGGEDFTKLLLHHFLDKSGLTFKKLDQESQALLLRLAENAKAVLSSGENATMQFEKKGKHHEWVVTIAEFEKIVEPLLVKLREPIVRALRDADLKASELDCIVMVGGACRMPMIRKNVGKLLSKLPLGNIDYDQTVALGAAVQGGLIAQDQSLNEVVLTDVMPYSLGVGVVNPNARFEGDLLFSPILERNSPVPVSKVEPFFPSHEKQKTVNLGIYQGESRYATDNVKIGLVSMPVTPGPTDENQLDVRFTFDLNGILEVQVQKGDDVKRLIVEGNPGVLSKQEVQASLEKLSELKMHPREKLENVVVLNRAVRLYSQNIGERRDFLADIISFFETELATQDLEKIADARQRVEEALDEIDDDPLGL